MFDWLRRSRKKQEIPEYSAIRERPNRGLPSDLAEQEPKELSIRSAAIEQSLLESARTTQDSPLFVEIVAGNEQSLLAITLPETTSHCLLIFSTPFRAADYVRTVTDSGSSHQYLSSNPLELVTLLRDAREVGIEQFTLDRCPRCNVYCAVYSSAMNTANDVVTCWAVMKATEFARVDLYLTYAQTSARAGDLITAREVLFETAAHVTFEDPRVHLALGQVAVALHESELLYEAKAFLQFFQLNSWEHRLDEIARSGSPNFEFVD